MGIPRFYAEIIKRYENIQKLVLENQIDYFFIDFNGIIYDAFANVYDKVENSVAFENLLINEILKLTKDLIVNVIKPSKCVYISIDGPAPRAKMVQQRSRRYKATVFEPMISNQIRQSYGVETVQPKWNPSINASPGTKFMMKLSNALKQKINKGFFGKNLQFILSDAFCPGEGEHKFLNYIRNLNEPNETSYCLYGKDADLLVLSMTLRKNNIFVCRPNDNKLNKDIYKYVYIDVNAMKNRFYNEIMGDLPKPYPSEFTLENIIRDTTFIDSLVGNDFVKAPFYLKVNQDSLNLIFGIYKNILHNSKCLLVHESSNAACQTDQNNNLVVNHIFLLNMFRQLSELEDKLMKEYNYKKLRRVLNSDNNHENKQKDYENEFDYIIKTYQHMPIIDQKNPLFKKYGSDFNRVNYTKNINIWKKQYYKFYFNIDVDNPKVYLEERKNICKNYLESLLFTLKYYHNEPPSWTWFYKYRVAPCFTDVYQTLFKMFKNKKNINSLQFVKGEPYTPFQQLMLILSHQASNILPKKFGELMINPEFSNYYPLSIDIDATAGYKYIYSEALLPEIDEERLIPAIKKLELKLGKNDTLRNTIQYEPFTTF
jgi:5'-3' exonuclease